MDDSKSRRREWMPWIVFAATFGLLMITITVTYAVEAWVIWG